MMRSQLPVLLFFLAAPAAPNGLAGTVHGQALPLLRLPPRLVQSVQGSEGPARARGRSTDRFAASFARICPVARATGYAEMTDHRFLTANRDVQQTTFANGVSVTVNFGQRPFRMSDGTTVSAMGYHVDGLPRP